MPLPRWDEHDLAALLALDPQGPGGWSTRFGDANLNGRSYGGQLLGQAMMAALMEVPVGREPTMMQFLFLQGAMPFEPLQFQVTPLQDGKRFSSRHVRAMQAGRAVLDAQVTCALPLAAPEHGEPSTAPAGEHPRDLPGMRDLRPGLLEEISRLGGYSQDHKPSVEFRIPDAERQIGQGDGQFRFWLKAARPLPEGARMHASAFAYLSDWWLNFASLGLHRPALGERRLYISSLNHAMWLHRVPRADDWFHVHATSPCAASGRGLSIARVHDQQGRLVASATQECLMAYAD